ncbi:L-seryl-tRNA(Sec) selenium transferase [Chloroflexota bacterium]
MENNEYRLIPSVDKVIAEKGMGAIKDILPHDTVVEVVRSYLENLRTLITDGASCPPIAEIIDALYADARSLWQPSLSPVINASGVILHTNLGRAPLSKESLVAIEDVAKGYTNLEFDLAVGKRGLRHVHVENLLCRLTGAEAAHVVNNNASAVLLALSALAKRKEVIVSRGQAVEIGGKFRVPDVMQQSGAKLKEVGTTNRTYISDYEEAISDKTAALLRVHRSNFMTVGFTHDVEIGEMAELAKKTGKYLIDDLGSGCLLDTTKYGLIYEPTVQESISGSADIVCFSGDKMLGGPQAGIIVGKKHLVEKLKKHPLSRAIRIDKLCLAGLATTLIHYIKGEAISKIPVWCMISTALAEIEKRASNWAKAFEGAAKVVQGVSTVGAGSIPGSTLETKLVAIKPGSKQKLQDMVRKLRTQKPYVVGRIEKDTLLLDPRTVLPDEDADLIKAIRTVI